MTCQHSYNCKIRPMENKDIDRIGKIWQEGSNKTHNFIPDYENFWSLKLDKVKQDFLNNSDVYVYERNGTVLGFIALGGKNYIKELFVDVQHQGEGIGTALLTFSKINQKSLTLHVYTKNIQAVKFYKNHGFAENGLSIEQETQEIKFLMKWDKEPTKNK